VIIFQRVNRACKNNHNNLAQRMEYNKGGSKIQAHNNKMHAPAKGLETIFHYPRLIFKAAVFLLRSKSPFSTFNLYIAARFNPCRQIKLTTLFFNKTQQL